MLTIPAVTGFLRTLHYPLALARSPLARALCGLRRSVQVSEPLSGDDLVFVQNAAAACLASIATEPSTLRGAESRQRQSTILARYEIDGEPRNKVARDLGISARQFYRERAEALHAFMAALSDRLGIVPASAGGVLELSGGVPVFIGPQDDVDRWDDDDVGPEAVVSRTPRRFA